MFSNKQDLHCFLVFCLTTSQCALDNQQTTASTGQTQKILGKIS